MFEQSLLQQGRTRKPLTVLLGVVFQILGIGAAVLIPLVYTDSLPRVAWARIILAPTPPAAPAPPLEARNDLSSNQFSYFALRVHNFTFQEYGPQNSSSHTPSNIFLVRGWTRGLSASVPVMMGLPKLSFPPPNISLVLVLR